MIWPSSSWVADAACRPHSDLYIRHQLSKGGALAVVLDGELGRAAAVVADGDERLGAGLRRRRGHLLHPHGHLRLLLLLLLLGRGGCRGGRDRGAVHSPAADTAGRLSEHTTRHGYNTQRDGYNTRPDWVERVGTRIRCCMWSSASRCRILEAEIDLSYFIAMKYEDIILLLVFLLGR